MGSKTKLKCACGHDDNDKNGECEDCVSCLKYRPLIELSEIRKLMKDLEEKLTMATESEGWNKDATPAFEERLSQFRKGQVSIFRWMERKLKELEGGASK